MIQKIMECRLEMQGELLPPNSYSITSGMSEIMSNVDEYAMDLHMYLLTQSHDGTVSRFDESL